MGGYYLLIGLVIWIIAVCDYSVKELEKPITTLILTMFLPICIFLWPAFFAIVLVKRWKEKNQN